MLHELIEDLKQVDARVLALVLAARSERKVHEESRCILDRVVAQLVCLVLQHV